MLITYELAKQLKDAGFPQRTEHYIDPDNTIFPLFCPTLSELIEACGEDFRWLKRNRHDKERVFMAQGRPHPVGNKEPKCWGKFPEEAVARLYLALHKNGNTETKENS